MDDQARALGVTTENWLDAPYNRYGFRHVPDLVRTAVIGRGDGPVRELPSAERDLGAFTFAFEGVSRTTRRDARGDVHGRLPVLQDGVVTERYLDGMQPTDTHLLMSVSKSLKAILCGGLAAGRWRPDDLVTAPPGARRNGLGGLPAAAPPRHARRSLGLRRRRVHDPRRLRLPDARPPRTIPADTATWIRTVPRRGTAAARSATARWPTTCSAGCSSGPAARHSRALLREIWSRIGAEQDAEIMLDHAGFAIVEGGICTTLRDWRGSATCASTTAPAGARSCRRRGSLGCSTVRGADRGLPRPPPRRRPAPTPSTTTTGGSRTPAGASTRRSA